MKKLFKFICLGLVSLASNSWAGGIETVIEPDYFSGFFVGGTGAFHMAGFNGSSQVTAPQDILVAIPGLGVNALVFPAGTLVNANIDGNSYDGFYGVQGGVGKVYGHRWYVGAVGFGEWGTQTATSDTSTSFMNQLTVPGLPFPSNQVSGNYSVLPRVTLKNDYGVAFKPGFLVAPKSMVYGKIGAIWTKLEVKNVALGYSVNNTLDPITGAMITSYSGSFSQSSRESETKRALLLGLGFEQFIYRDFITLNVEYNYANYGHVTTATVVVPVLTASTSISTSTATAIVPGAPLVAQTTSNARVSTLLAGINFYFGSHWF